MTGLKDKRILIVEDEYFIATDLQRAFHRAGAEIVGPVGDLAQGLKLVDRSLDAALLDVDLNGSASFPIADALDKVNVPHLFLTGYDPSSLPERYRHRRLMIKPFTMASVVGTMERLCADEALR